MSTVQTTAVLAEELTSRLIEIEAVQEVFPAPSVLRLPLRPVGRGLVEVKPRGPLVAIHARLATSRGTPTADVVRDVEAAVGRVLGAQRYSLRIEVAVVE